MRTNIKALKARFAADTPIGTRLGKFLNKLKDGEVVDSAEILRNIHCSPHSIRLARVPARFKAWRMMANLEHKNVTLWGTPKTLESLRRELSKIEIANQGSL